MPETKKKQPTNYQYFLQTRKFLAIALGLAGLSLFVGLTILFPNIQKAQAANSKLQTEKKRLANLQRKSNTLQNVQTTDLYSKKDVINAILPSSKPLIQLLNQIDKVSSENKVIISEFGVIPGEISTQSAKPETKKTAPGKNLNLGNIETKIIIVGDIDNINSFLKTMNTVTPLTETTELALKAVNRQDLQDPKNPTTSRVFEATLTLTSYFFVGKVQSDPTQMLPDLSSFTSSEATQLDQFQVPVSSQNVDAPSVQGGGKVDLFQ